MFSLLYLLFVTAAFKLSNECRRIVQLTISGLLISTLVDTGAAVSLMDFDTYVAICQASKKQPRIKHDTSEVCGLGKTRLEKQWDQQKYKSQQ